MATIRFRQLLESEAPNYLLRFQGKMPHRHWQVLGRILACRTPALGGCVFHCEKCGRDRYSYHSCNDRHCPCCGQQDSAQWLENNRARLPSGVDYFMVTFTVPAQLRQLFRSNQSAAYDALFASSSQALQDIADNPRHLGAQLGMLGVLHTWTRTLVYHPHIHFLIPAGGLSRDGLRWMGSRVKYLFPVKVLAKRFCHLLYTELQARLPEAHVRIGRRVWKQSWIVHSQHVGNGQKALAYLSNYVGKTATGNRVLRRLADGRIIWPYVDRQTGRAAQITLSVEELLRRFCQHILPAGYHRVRYYGYLHPAGRQRGNRVRALLCQPALLSAEEKRVWLGKLEAARASTQTPTGGQETNPPAVKTCPHCGHGLVFAGVCGKKWVVSKVSVSPAPLVTRLDTS